MTEKPGVTCKLRLPNQAHLFEHIQTNAKHATKLISPGSHCGKSVAICGAGPSLRDAYPVGDEVWACNSALPYLVNKSVRVTHGFAIDQGEEMLAAHEWGTTFDVEYMVASSVHPRLVEHLLASGRSLTWFHSFLGIPDPEGWESDKYLSYEAELYATLYGKTGQQTGVAGHGLNSVSRAICLALGMGFSEINVYGNDCCAKETKERMPEWEGEDQHGEYYASPEYGDWLSRLVLYADDRRGTTFGHGRKEPFAEADFGGRLWHSRPDMAVTAVHEVELFKTWPGRIHFMGDTLPAYLCKQDQAFLDRMPILSAFGEITNIQNASKAA